MSTSRRIAVLKSLSVLWLALPLAAQSPTFKRDAAAAPYSGGGLLAADLDADGDVDLLAATIATSALNDGTGRMVDGWTAPGVALYSSSEMTSFALLHQLVDLDGDGVRDLIEGAQSPYWPSTAVWYAGLPGGGYSNTANPFGSTGQYFLHFDSGDVDGDGDADLIARVFAGNSFTVDLFLRNDGSGTFTIANDAVGLETVGSPTTPTAFSKLVDLEGDGDLDLVRYGFTNTNGTTSPSLVQENVGGVFSAPTYLSAPPPPTGSLKQSRLRCADFDGDGLVDIVRYANVSDPIILYRQTSPFIFAAGAEVFLAPGAPFVVKDVVAADLDSDGVPELMVAGDRGVASLRFVGGAWIPHAPELPGAADLVLPFDADGDGDVDLFIGDNVADGFTCNHRFAYNLGGSAFATPPGPLGGLEYGGLARVGFVGTTQDGLPHVLSFNGTDLYQSLNNGFGRFELQTRIPISNAPLGYTDNSHPNTLIGRFVAEDFDGDGDVDAVAMNVKMPGYAPTTHCTTYMRNDGAAGFVGIVLHTAPTTYFKTTDVATGDVNGDGLPDVVASGASMRVFLSVPGSTPVLSSGQPPTTAYAASLGDFDDDGDLDAALTTTAGFGVIWINDGAGVFTVGPFFTPASDACFSADFNGDGLCDVLFGYQLWLRTGPLQFAVPTTIATGSSTNVFAFAIVVDLDLDGDPDIVRNNGTGLRNDGPAGFTWTTWYPHDGLGRPIVARDLDLDGDLDLIVCVGPVALVNETRQLRARGPLRLGVPEVFETIGPPGGTALLAVSYGTFVPAVATPFGALTIDVFTAAILAVGPLDANGRALIGAVLDPVISAGLVGTTYFFQAVVDGDAAGPRLTNALPLTVLPI